MQFHVVDIGLFVLAAGLVLLGEAIVDDDFHNVEQAAKKDETACRYKVWYLESCDRTSHSQIVHLILTIGGDGCDVAKHVTKVCSPSDENKSPVAAEEATFKRLLEGKDRSKKALQRAIAETNKRDLPEVLSPDNPNASARDAAEETLLKEIDHYDLAKVEADPLKFVKELEKQSQAKRAPSGGGDKEAMAEALSELLKEKLEKRGARDMLDKVKEEGRKARPVVSLGELNQILKNKKDEGDMEKEILKEIESELKRKEGARSADEEKIKTGDIFRERKEEEERKKDSARPADEEKITPGNIVGERKKEEEERKKDVEEELEREVETDFVREEWKEDEEEKKVKDNIIHGEYNTTRIPENVNDDYVYNPETEESKSAGASLLPHEKKNDTATKMLYRLLHQEEEKEKQDHGKTESASPPDRLLHQEEEREKLDHGKPDSTSPPDRLLHQEQEKENQDHGKPESASPPEGNYDRAHGDKRHEDRGNGVWTEPPKGNYDRAHGYRGHEDKGNGVWTEPPEGNYDRAHSDKGHEDRGNGVWTEPPKGKYDIAHGNRENEDKGNGVWTEPPKPTYDQEEQKEKPDHGKPKSASPPEGNYDRAHEDIGNGVLSRQPKGNYHRAHDDRGHEEIGNGVWTEPPQGNYDRAHGNRGHDDIGNEVSTEPPEENDTRANGNSGGNVVSMEPPEENNTRAHGNSGHEDRGNRVSAVLPEGKYDRAHGNRGYKDRGNGVWTEPPEGNYDKAHGNNGHKVRGNEVPTDPPEGNYTRARGNSGHEDGGNGVWTEPPRLMTTVPTPRGWEQGNSRYKAEKEAARPQWDYKQLHKTNREEHKGNSKEELKLEDDDKFSNSAERKADSQEKLAAADTNRADGADRDSSGWIQADEAGADKLKEDAGQLEPKAKELKKTAKSKDKLTEWKHQEKLKEPVNRIEEGSKSRMDSYNRPKKSESDYARKGSVEEGGQEKGKKFEEQFRDMVSKTKDLAGDGTKIINWMIQNMPEGKQTVLIF